MAWLAGTLELTSKVRYGLTSRGVPIFRFIPYDKRFSPMAVGCSMRDLSTNVHAIVETLPAIKNEPHVLAKGNLIQTFGPPTVLSERSILLNTYAYDSNKGLRNHPAPLTESPDLKPHIHGFTFNIDPSGCKDVDDTFTIVEHGNDWRVSINIADVASWITEDSQLDVFARKRSTTFYSDSGEALAPMFPRAISESSASLLPGEYKPTLSLEFTWDGVEVKDYKLYESSSKTHRSFTYEEANFSNIPEMAVLCDIAVKFGGVVDDSHTWVQALMILYNQYIGNILRNAGLGILRRHTAPAEHRLEMIRQINHTELMFLAFEAAEYCLATDADTNHYGLGKDAYAYATSPLRRYADLVNQRIIKGLLNGVRIPGPTAELVGELNRRQKQAKAFTRDLFFLKVISEQKLTQVNGIIIEKMEDRSKVWVPDWKRIITVRESDISSKDVRISWYHDKNMPRWKEKMVFRVSQPSL